MVSQPTAVEGEIKLITPLTLENIAAAVIAEGLATQAEIDVLVDKLYGHARDPGILMSMPRVVQAWAREPA